MEKIPFLEMALPSKSLDQITETELQALIQAGESESKIIEYKETLPGNSDSDKKEFLYDVSSFANAFGGTIIYGMKAKDGVPVELSGIVGLNPDAEKLRLQAISQSGLQPRIPSVEMEATALTNGRKALLLRIQRSWAAPHMVTFKGASKFYSRHSNGKYQLDVTELRAAFLASETVSEKMAAFRTDRLSRILNDETPVLIKDPTRLVLHVLPFSSFAPGGSVDIKQLRYLRGGAFPLMGGMNSYSGHHNFEGYAYFEGSRDNSHAKYTQVFRSGCVEVVDSSFFRAADGQRIIDAWEYEPQIVAYLKDLSVLEKHLGITPPFVVTLSLLNVRAYRMYAGNAASQAHGRVIARDHLQLPDALLDESGANIPKLLRPAFDSVWNACGYGGSNSFDPQGNWLKGF